MHTLMRVLVVATMPGLMFAAMGHVELHEACEPQHYSSGLLSLIDVLPPCPAWPDWSTIFWLVAAGLLAAAVFGVRSARRPGLQATR
jgi:hypothetical protein